ncbi:hypothetical protein GCM10022220_03940 [Actinocatenispora rupis]|uniref:ACT domain-containing protein n=2 Tax=Actinocatenispora rupis TaxID=519421 RepID=A0A8J3J5G4_9ACTN|nr:hypothetical protein Aru02nite_59790 [Actinocatenispora rupis]
MRIRLPDRPGALGRAAAALGTVGIDIHQVQALERAANRAIVDLVVALPAAMLPGAVARILAEIPGVRVEGSWQTSDSLDLDTDIEVLAETVANPGRALHVLVDAAPKLLHAHWAAALAVPGGDVVHASWRTPKIGSVELGTLRPRALTAPDGSRLALAPLGSRYAILVGRRNAPPFHPTELRKLSVLADATARVLTGVPEQRRGGLSLVRPSTQG